MINPNKDPLEMNWYGAEFSNEGRVIKVAHNFEDDEVFQGIFYMWVKDAKVIDTEHFVEYVSALRVAGIIPYYAISWTEFSETMEKNNIKLEGYWEEPD